MPALKKGPKLVLLLLFAFGLFQGAKYAMAHGLIPTPAAFKSRVLTSNTALASNEDPVSVSIAANVTKLPLPSTQPVTVPGPEVRFEQWFWNAQLACNLANGGPRPTAGSLTAKYGVNLRIIRNDVTPKMQENLVAFANALSKGDPNPAVGTHFVAIMGDQAAGFLGPINAQLRKIGPEYQAEVVYSCGRSRGEDQFMGPPSWKANPRNAVGGTVATVLYEGDWNIVMKWARDNNVPVNPDERTYDPEALNFLAPSDYLDAAAKFIQNYCESRPVVQQGRKTGAEHKVCVDAISSWTPADVNAAEGRGGLVRIVSTKEYSGQMPNVVIGIRKWNQDNRATVVNMIRAFGEAGDQVLAYPEARQRAAEAQYAVVNEWSPEKILRYYDGVEIRDKAGQFVELGGSRVHNLADNLRWFGLASGSGNKFAATYTVFADIVKEVRPDLLPSYPPVSEILNTSYLEEAAQRSTVTTAETSTFAGGTIRDRVSSERVYIQFRTGSAELTPAAEATLRRVYENLLVASDLAITITGHTDNTGNPVTNQTLSEARARAVQTWLQQKSPGDFPAQRFAEVAGRGQEEPVADNASESGRAQNRRVEVVLGRQ